jgi:cytoskeleton protein RodZ
MVPAATPLQQAQPMRMAVVAAALPAAHAASPAAEANLSPAAASKALPSRHREIDAVFTYSGSSWTEVYDATGRRLLYGLPTAPATRKLQGVPPLSVMLGDASDVTIEVGGRAALISRFVRSDHTARFLIAADGSLLAAPRKKGG